MDERESASEKITVVIPTYNRPSCIAYLTENCLKKYSGKMLCFEIHDSSTDDNTRKILEEADLGDDFRYFHYDPEMDGDVKTMQAISKVQTPYVYLLGDGVTIDFNALEQWLTEIEFEKYSVIGMRDRKMPKFSRRGAPEVYATENVTEYFNYYHWPLILYGASIIRNCIAQEALAAIQKYASVSSFMYVSGVFEGLVKLGGPCYFSYVDFVGANPQKEGSYWFLSHRALEIFCYQYYQCMQLLPESYHAMAPSSLKRHNDLSGLFRLKSVLRMRATGNLTWKLYREYKFYVKKTVPHMSYIYFALFIPAFVMRGIRRIYKFIKGKGEKA